MLQISRKTTKQQQQRQRRQATWGMQHKQATLGDAWRLGYNSVGSNKWTAKKTYKTTHNETQKHTLKTHIHMYIHTHTYTHSGIHSGTHSGTHTLADIRTLKTWHSQQFIDTFRHLANLCIPLNCLPTWGMHNYLVCSMQFLLDCLIDKAVIDWLSVWQIMLLR